MPSVKAKQVILVLIDISGYTKFMLANKETVHSQLIIADLIRKIIDEVELPLHISKLEGDAVFMYAVKRDEESWASHKEQIGAGLERFFDAFSRELVRVGGSNLCSCNSCKNVSKLRLKIFVHSGEALFQTIRGFDELSGVDVILIHRLLKNTVDANHYILLTKEGMHDIKFPHAHKAASHIEHDKDLGDTQTYVYLPEDPEACPAGAK